MLELAGDVTGMRILDVGCGAGHYAAELLARGARVVGVDGSGTLLDHTRARTGSLLHDLEAPLDFAGDASFDGAVCALVLHHLTRRGCWPSRAGYCARGMAPGLDDPSGG